MGSILRAARASAILAFGLAPGAACGRMGFDEVAGATAPLFADGFEGTLTPWIANGGVDVSGGPPAPTEGAAILLAQAGSAMTARAEVDLGAPVTSGPLFVRAYYYLPSGYAVTDLSVLELHQPGQANMVLVNSPQVGLYTAIDARGGGRGAFALPRDTWTCVEILADIEDAPDGTWEVWVDGVLAMSISGLDTFAGGVNRITIGITWAGAGQEPSTVYSDSVVVSRSPIGCL